MFWTNEGMSLVSNWCGTIEIMVAIFLFVTHNCEFLNKVTHAWLTASFYWCRYGLWCQHCHVKTSYCDRPLLRLLAPFHQQQRRQRVYTIDDYYDYWLIITNKRINLERVKKIFDYYERNVRNLKNRTSLLLCKLWRLWWQEREIIIL